MPQHRAGTADASTSLSSSAPRSANGIRSARGASHRPFRTLRVFFREASLRSFSPISQLSKVENYRDFLEARKFLLAEATNEFMAELLHGEKALLAGLSAAEQEPHAEKVAMPLLPGGSDSEEEELLLEALNSWVAEQGLPEGQLMYEVADPDSGKPVAVFDLAWPEGLQEGLSQSVAVLINEGPEVLEIAGRFGYRYFTSPEAFKRYVEHEILAVQGV